VRHSRNSRSTIPEILINTIDKEKKEKKRKEELHFRLKELKKVYLQSKIVCNSSNLLGDNGGCTDLIAAGRPRTMYYNKIT
jgi:hypothetical protein